MRSIINRTLVPVVAASALCVAVTPAMATEAPLRPAVVETQPVLEPSASNRALAARVIGVTNANFEKQVLEAVRVMLADMNLRDADEKLAIWFEKNAGQILLVHLRTMLQEYETIYANTFTAAELEAMGAFYETPEGRTIADKQVDLGIAIAPVNARVMEAYMIDLLTQMCSANDCGGDKGASSQSGKLNAR